MFRDASPLKFFYSIPFAFDGRLADPQFHTAIYKGEIIAKGGTAEKSTP